MKACVWNESINTADGPKLITVLRYIEEGKIKPRLCLFSQVNESSSPYMHRHSDRPNLAIQVTSVLSVTPQTARETAKRLGVVFGTCTAPDVLRRLRPLASLPINTAQVAMIRVSDAVKLWEHYAVPNCLIQGMNAVRQSQPPSTSSATPPHSLTWGGQQRHAPGGGEFLLHMKFPRLPALHTSLFVEHTLESPSPANGSDQRRLSGGGWLGSMRCICLSIALQWRYLCCAGGTRPSPSPLPCRGAAEWHSRGEHNAIRH